MNTTKLKYTYYYISIRGAHILKHDEYVEELLRKLERHYDSMYRALPLYSSKGRLIAEIDLIGVGSHGVDVFEVKCSNRIVKARKQLRKIKKIFGSELGTEINAWFYCGEADSLLQVL